MSARTLTALLAVATLGITGCSSVADGPGGQPSPVPSPAETEPGTPSLSPSPTQPPSPAPDPTAEELSGEWAGSFDLLLPNGWSVQDCEGGRLDACVSADGELLGDVELLNGYPLDESQITSDPETVLSELAESFLEHFRLDRAEGCPDFEYVADEIRDVTVGGQPGKRAAFSVVDSDGRVVERVINHFTLQGEHYAIVNTDAYVTEGGCLGPSEYDPSFVPSDLATMEQYLDELVAGMSLPPAPTA